MNNLSNMISVKANEAFFTDYDDQRYFFDFYDFMLEENNKIKNSPIRDSEEMLIACYNLWHDFVSTIECGESSDRYCRSQNGLIDLNDVYHLYLQDVGITHFHQNSKIKNHEIKRRNSSVVDVGSVSDLYYLDSFRIGAWNEFFNESCSRYDRSSIEKAILRGWKMAEKTLLKKNYQEFVENNSIQEFYNLFISSLGEKFLINLGN